MMPLTLEERGAYNAVLDLIYQSANKLADNDRFIACRLVVDLRIWKRIKARLLALDKLYLKDGLVHNARADEEVREALDRIASAANAGVNSGRSRREKSRTFSNETKELTRTTVTTDDEQTFELPTLTKTNKPSSSEKTTATTKNGFHANGRGKNGDRVTVQDPAERLARFQKWLAESLGPEGWSLVVAAQDPTSPHHLRCLRVCKDHTRSKGKGWPHNWPGAGKDC